MRLRLCFLLFFWFHGKSRGMPAHFQVMSPDPTFDRPAVARGLLSVLRRLPGYLWEPRHQVLLSTRNNS